MPGNDINIVLGPQMANRIRRVVEFVERNPRYNTTPPPGFPNVNIPIPKIGKAHENIAPRTFGAVDCWEGVPGSETASTFITTTIQEFNLLDRTITAGKFVWMFGQYIFGAVFPAADVWGTVTATGASYSVSVSDFANGDDPGATITAITDGTASGQTISNGAAAYCRWHDRKQQYIMVSWSC